MDVYRLTQDFPSSERFGLTSQMRRAAVSIPSNIAEGAGRGGGSFQQFLGYAAGSASELDTQIDIARQIGIGDSAALDRAQADNDSVRKMLWGLMKQTESRSS